MGTPIGACVSKSNSNCQLGDRRPILAIKPGFTTRHWPLGMGCRCPKKSADQPSPPLPEFSAATLSPRLFFNLSLAVAPSRCLGSSLTHIYLAQIPNWPCRIAPCPRSLVSICTCTASVSVSIRRSPRFSSATLSLKSRARTEHYFTTHHVSSIKSPF